MAYIMEFRDESEKDELIEKMHKAKNAIMDACEALEEADSNNMHERGRYRGGNYRNNMSYRRGGRYRDDWDEMDYRNSRYGY